MNKYGLTTILASLYFKLSGYVFGIPAFVQMVSAKLCRSLQNFQTLSRAKCKSPCEKKWKYFKVIPTLTDTFPILCRLVQAISDLFMSEVFTSFSLSAGEHIFHAAAVAMAMQ